MNRQEAAQLSLLGPLRHAFEILFSQKKELVESLRNSTIEVLRSLLNARIKPYGSRGQESLASSQSAADFFGPLPLEQLHPILEVAKQLGLKEVPKVIEMLFDSFRSSWEFDGKFECCQEPSVYTPENLPYEIVLL